MWVGLHFHQLKPPPPTPQLDSIFYNYADKKLNASIAAYGAADIAQAVQALRDVTQALNEFCECNDLGREELDYCQWLSMDDMQYERAIGRMGEAKPVKLSWLNLHS